MSNTKLSSAQVKGIEATAADWGKRLAREAFPMGPGLDVSLVEMEEVAAVATKAMVQGAMGEMTDRQAQRLEGQLACPRCGRLCDIEHKPRTLAVRGGIAQLNEPVGHCSGCRRDFFPSA